MSEVVGEGIIQIRTDESGVDYDGAGKRAGSGFSRGFGGSIKGLAGLIGGVVAGQAVIGFVSDAFGEAREAQKIGAVSEQIIKSTGGAAKITAAQLGDLAGAISSKTGVDDEAIQSGANLLLTFKNVRNEAGKGADVFDRATAAAVDLSAAGFGSIEGGSKMLGKALNDPVKGISALGRAGVTFTADQQALIKSLVEGGDTLGAQKIILGEVESQVGGVAEASATAGEKASVAFGNIKESVGTALLPVLDLFAGFFTTTLAPAIQSGISALSGLGPVFSQIGGFISSTFSGEGGAGTAFQTFIGVITGSVLPAVSRLADLFIANVVPAVQTLFAAFQTAVSEILPVVVSYVTGSLIPTFEKIYTVFISQVLPAVLTLVSAFVSQVLPVLVKVIAFVAGNLLPIFGTVVTVVLRVVGVILSLVAAFINAIPRIAGFASSLTSMVRDGIDRVRDAVADLPGKILELGGRFLDAGKAIIGKFVEGLKGAGGLVSDIAGNVWDAVRGLLNDAITKINAALEFTISLPGPDITINPPNIPALAGGGLVTRPTISLTGEAGREGVIPLTRPAALRPIIDALDAARSTSAPTAGGAPVEVHVHTPTDDPEGTAITVVNRMFALGWV